MNATTRIGFIGAGQMATALARGWLTAGLVVPDGLSASDPFVAARQRFQDETGVAATADNAAVVETSDLLILAVKPQTMKGVLDELRSRLQARHLVLSIAAGVTLRQLRESLGNVRLVRVMPNTPCLVGASAAGYAPGETATTEDMDLVHRLLNAVGRAFRVSEGLLDAVTGLSGSGPAYVAVMIEALADGGVRMGLPRETALTLAAQTVMGTAKMILEAELHPAKLKDMVASPGGTTIAGLHELERGGVRGALMDAVQAATKRATELGKG